MFLKSCSTPVLVGSDAFAYAPLAFAAACDNAGNELQLISSDVSKMDKNFDMQLTETTIERELSFYDLRGHPPLQSIANCRTYLLTKLPIATNWGVVFQAQRRLLQSGGFGVQYVQSMRTLEISITADLYDYCTNDRPGLSLHRTVSLGDDMLNFGSFQTYLRYRKGVLVAAAENNLSIKNDSIPLWSRNHFDFLGLTVRNGRGCLDERKLVKVVAFFWGMGDLPPLIGILIMGI